jgi:hypothetical protein
MQDPRQDPRQDARQDRPLDLGLYAKSARPAPGLIEIAAAALSVLWLVAVVTYALRLPEGSGAVGTMLTVLAALLPLAFLWIAVITARSVRALRAEAARLQAAVDSMRNAYVAQQQAAAAGLKAAPERRSDDTPPPPRRDPAPPPPDRRPAPARARVPPVPPEDQPGLALDTPTDDGLPPLPLPEVIAALNFPDSDEDVAAFRALRAALEDRNTAKLIRSAQDVLTLLSQDGIYMDDLRPGPPVPDLWRRFAQGERGRAIADLGTVRDPASLDRTAARMREDPVFRDAAHHFLRQFDRSFQKIEKAASDADLIALADTRTARAFLLFGRVSGTFD